jgi:hypothetical protein
MGAKTKQTRREDSWKEVSSILNILVGELKAKMRSLTP